MSLFNCILGILGFIAGIYKGNIPMALFALASALGWGRSYYFEKH